MAALGDQLRARRPDLDWGGRRADARRRAARARRRDVGAARSWPTSTSSSGRSPGLRRRLAGRRRRGGGRAAPSAGRRSTTSRRCAGSSASWSAQGYLTRRDGELELTAEGRAPARRDRAAPGLRRSCEARGRGDHDMHDAGAAGEPDRRHPARGSSATSSRSTSSAPCATRVLPRRARRGPATPVQLRVEDFEVRRDRAAYVRRGRACSSTCRTRWCCDGTWGAAKQTALALHTLVTTQYPQDAMQIIGFSNYARVLQPTSWPGSTGTWCRAPTCSTR